MNNKKGFFEKIFYNNKFLMVFSVVMAVVLWAVVKINYSDNTTRTISDVKISVDDSLARENDYIMFADSDSLYVDVQVSGRAYDINAYSLSRDEIIVEATSGYIDSAGYKTLNLTARTEDADVDVVKVSPSSVTVFFDRTKTEEFNVEARLTNDIESLSSDGYYVGQPVPSVSTVSVTGPASVIDRISNVYFTATVDEKSLPLTATKEVGAEIDFDLERKRDAQFLVCDNVGNDVNPATVTIPVSVIKSVDTSVKFVNQPSFFNNNPPKYTITPSSVDISFNPEDEEYNTFNVGTIDFRKLSNKVNTFEFDVDEKVSSLLVDKDIKSFKVTVDLSSFKSKTIDASASNVVFLNQSPDYRYTASLENSGLDKVVVFGSDAGLSKIKADNLQIEINVSSLDTAVKTGQSVKISNISIRSEDITDCWISGTYRAVVSVSDKNG